VNNDSVALVVSLNAASCSDDPEGPNVDMPARKKIRAVAACFFSVKVIIIIHRDYELATTSGKSNKNASGMLMRAGLGQGYTDFLEPL